MSWYKLDYKGELLQGDRIDGPGFSLHNPWDVPQDGWQWFDSEELALAAFAPVAEPPVAAPALEAKKQLADAYLAKAEEILTNTTINTIKEVRDSTIQVFAEVAAALD